MQSYETYDTGSSAAAAGIIGALMIPLLVLSVIMIISYWKIFTKAGKPGWAAIIPIYNLIVLLEIVGKPAWWFLLFIIPCVNIIFLVWTFNLLSKSFGQSEGFTIGLLLLGIVFFPLLAFGNYPYLGPAGAGPLHSYDPSKDYRDPFSNNNPPPQV
ncbi:DUF5684 domain-containing protein [Mucilaginibacter koreensis]